MIVDHDDWEAIIRGQSAAKASHLSARKQTRKKEIALI
jgi:hypothetical protein